jgi:type IV pilus assembly protein PilN
MIRINLLPAEIIGGPERNFEPKHVIAVWGVALLIILVPFYGVQYTRRKHLRSDIEEINMKLRALEPVVAQVETLEKIKAELMQRKGIIQQLESERLRYPYFIDDFLKLMPSNVWLTNLTTTLPADINSITVGMDVVALDHYAVADMISNLETSQIFFDVELGPIQLTQTQTGQSITFHLNTTYKKVGGDPNAVKKS